MKLTFTNIRKLKSESDNKLTKRLLNKKDLATFMTYATEQARKLYNEQKSDSQAVCVLGDDIMRWAIHYFEEDSITVFISNQCKRILLDMPAPRYSHGNGLTEKVYVNDIERNLKFSVVVRELGKIILSFILSCLVFFFHFLHLRDILPFGGAEVALFGMGC